MILAGLPLTAALSLTGAASTHILPVHLLNALGTLGNLPQLSCLLSVLNEVSHKMEGHLALEGIRLVAQLEQDKLHLHVMLFAALLLVRQLLRVQIKLSSANFCAFRSSSRSCAV